MIDSDSKRKDLKIHCISAFPSSWVKVSMVPSKPTAGWKWFFKNQLGQIGTGQRKKREAFGDEHTIRFSIQWIYMNKFLQSILFACPNVQISYKTLIKASQHINESKVLQMFFLRILELRSRKQILKDTLRRFEAC